MKAPDNGPIKARVKESGKIVEGFLDGKGHFDVPVDHGIFDRYDVEELEFDTLQEPEVDLEKEIDKTVNECTDGYNFDWDKFARHFYELGLNTKKEENK